MKRFPLVVAVGVALSGCALKSDIRRVEDQLADMRERTARADSVRAVTLVRILDQLDAFHSEVRDSLQAQRTTIMGLQGAMRTDMTQVLRNMVAMQELMGQSQAGLDQLRRELDQRLQDQPVAMPLDSAGRPRAMPPRQEMGPDADELYNIGMQQYRQSSIVTARMAFHRILTAYPDSPLAPDAMFFIAESWKTEQPDSAAIYYERVIADHVEHARAPTALYQLGLLAESQGKTDEARLHFNRLIQSFPNSDEAQLAREKINRVD